jgi:hypothetical protein
MKHNPFMTKPHFSLPPNLIVFQKAFYLWRFFPPLLRSSLSPSQAQMASDARTWKSGIYNPEMKFKNASLVAYSRAAAKNESEAWRCNGCFMTMAQQKTHDKGKK